MVNLNPDFRKTHNLTLHNQYTLNFFYLINEESNTFA